MAKKAKKTAKKATKTAEKTAKKAKKTAAKGKKAPAAKVKKTKLEASKAPKVPVLTKKAAALAVVLSSSDRMAVEAKKSVYAISSEKTVGMFEAGDSLVDDAEEIRMLKLAETDGDVLPSELRRSTRDQFGPFRVELNRPENFEDDVHATWRVANVRFRHEMKPGSKVTDVKKVERDLGVEFPPSYYDFCLEWNGGELYVRDGGGYRIIGATEQKAESKGPLCGRMQKPYVPVVALGRTDYLALDMSKTNRSGENPLYWWRCDRAVRKVGDSFGLWLKKLIECDGRAFWWDLA